MENNVDNQISIELKDDVASGIYSNLAVITHSNTEFVADFIQMLPGMPKAQVKSRVIMTPVNAKRLMQALYDNIQKHEQAFGPIKDVEQHNDTIRFGTPSTQA